MGDRAIRLGIVGTGMIAHKLVDAARRSGVAMPIAVYSRTPESGGAFAAEEGLRCETDFRAFLSSSELDAVYIASPNALHFGQAMGALRAGKHVLCEKPTVSNLGEYLILRREADARGLVLMEAMRPLHDPAFLLLREHLPLLGRIRRVDLEYCQYSSRYDRFRSGEILNAFNPSLSNAAVMDIGVYPIAVLTALFGLPESTVSHSLFLSNGFEGAGDLLCRYGDMLATVSYSKITDSVVPSVITGERGSITVDRLSGIGSLTLCLRGEAKREIPYRAHENDMVHEVVDFCETVRTGAERLPFAEYSLRTMTLLDAVRRQNGIVFPADSKQ